MKMVADTSQMLLGLGGTVDYEVRWDAATIADLIAEFALTQADLDPAIQIHSERDLVRCVLGILAGGGGGERFVHSPDLLQEFAERFDYEITLGGTGVRAGIALSQLSVPSTVHLVSIDDHVRRLLPTNVTYLCSAQKDSLDPHLIVQYPAGIAIDLPEIRIETDHPNRIILAHDVANKMLELHPDLAATLATCEVYLACGFNVIRDQEVLDDRLHTVERAMAGMPQGSLVFFEEAEYHVPKFSLQVRQVMIRYADVYSMNEDELQAILGIEINLLCSTEVGAALRALQKIIPARNLLIHTKYWALLLGQGAQKYAQCLESAVTVAATRYRVGDNLNKQTVEATRQYPLNTAGAAVLDELSQRFGNSFVGVPAYTIDISDPTTIGLGDTFSAGFIFQYHCERQHAEISAVL
ncbi:ADP-dependent glucokinase/phosphofructokinase [Jonesiaceae bacterium BS-20]|uniref:ADP-dependent glucokinase/phosphofructokinase n=1 Tax=Jonesiaceae bacterium BS-20 TaxID=3120821 RepID=A0AAU7DRM2_9MICO